VPVYELFGTRPVAAARVLASLDDEAHSALLLERSYDRGRTFLWTSTIDPAWTRAPESPATLVPLVHELLRYAPAHEGLPRNLPIGAPLAAEADQFPRAATWTRPDGARRALDGEPEALPGGRWRLPSVPGREVAAAGLYRIDTDGAGAFSFAALFEPEEGDLARLAPGELAAVHPSLIAVDEGSGERDEGPADATQRGELWRPIAALCLAFLVLESLWAAWIGNRRRVRA
jgi:hypothetical protein